MSRRVTWPSDAVSNFSTASRTLSNNISSAGERGDETGAWVTAVTAGLSASALKRASIPASYLCAWTGALRLRAEAPLASPYLGRNPQPRGERVAQLSASGPDAPGSLWCLPARHRPEPLPCTTGPQPQPGAGLHDFLAKVLQAPRACPGSHTAHPDPGLCEAVPHRSRPGPQLRAWPSCAGCRRGCAGS